ncbi:MAG: DUF1269 domain-containing protein [Nitrococcus sp.]|nr:DUF1269 domain-containing protein [Nitrococcus sp.]
MRRLYFLLPNLETTRNVVHELLLNHVEERHIHVVARKGVPLGDLPEAGMSESSDFIPAAERGMLAGAATAAVAGLVMAAIPATAVVVGGAEVVLLTLTGAGFGAWVSSMIGLSFDSSRLERFHEAVEAGQLLMLVDVPKRRVDEIEELVRSHHNDVDIKGTEPLMPNFP